MTGRDGLASLERPRIISLPYVGVPTMCPVLSARRLGTLCGPIVGVSTSTHIIWAVGSDRIGWRIDSRARSSYCGSRIVELWSCPFQISVSKFYMQKL